MVGFQLTHLVMHRFPRRLVCTGRFTAVFLSCPPSPVVAGFFFNVVSLGIFFVGVFLSFSFRRVCIFLSGSDVGPRGWASLGYLQLRLRPRRPSPLRRVGVGGSVR